MKSLKTNRNEHTSIERAKNMFFMFKLSSLFIVVLFVKHYSTFYD